MSAATIHVPATGLPSPRQAGARVLAFPERGTPRVVPGRAVGTRAAAPESRPALRLTRRGRLVVTLASLLLVSLAGAVGAQSATGGTEVGAASGLTSVTVLPGETLWSLAEEHGSGGDVRDAVAEIRSLNGLTSSSLQAGQVLLVPTS